MTQQGFYLASALSLLLVSACSDNTSHQHAEQATGPAAMPSASELVTEIRSAMGITDLQAIQYEGYAWRVRNSFRQTRTASPPWVERDEIIHYKRAIDLSNGTSLARGDTFAHNLFFDPRVAGEYVQYIEREQPWSQQLEIYLTPWGFLRGAEAHDASIERHENGYTLTWQTDDHYRSPADLPYTVSAIVDDNHRILRTETRVEDSFMGDMLVATNFSDYAEIDGMQVPTVMEQERGGGMVFGVHIRDAKANPADVAALTQAPEQRRGPGFGGGASDIEPVIELGDGVWEITGGYHALVVEFSDHVVVFEAGQSEAHGESIIERVKGLSDKPIRYLINSHPHADHTAGIVPFVREGAVILTHHRNVDFLEMALSTPRTLLGEETLSPRFRPAPDGVTTLQDDSGMRLELHHIPNWHSEGTLVAVLPDHGVLFQADFTLPVPGAKANPFVINLAEYVRDAGIEFERYRAVHPATVEQTMDDLMAALDDSE